MNFERKVLSVNIFKHASLNVFTLRLATLQITTADEFWTWTEEILLPVLYPSFWYNGWEMKYLDRQFPLYTEAFRIGPPRLTQVRKAPGTNHDLFPIIVHNYKTIILMVAFLS